MFESIYIGMTGLLGYQKGLRIISDNTSNLNTPGFKASLLQFANLTYSQDTGNGANTTPNQSPGYGLTTYPTILNWAQGELRQTNNELDLAIDGQGLFALKDQAGQIHYTRAGQFQFDGGGVLINRNDNAQVMGLTADGQFTPISLAGRRTSPARATSTIKLSGNLSSTGGNQTISGLQVIDHAGGSHSLSLALQDNSAATPSIPGNWTVTVRDGATTVGSGTLQFNNGTLDPSTAKLRLTYTPTGQTPVDLTLDFSGDVTSFASGSSSTLAFQSQDGLAAGTLSKATFDASGTLIFTYSNGQTVSGTQLAVGRFYTPSALRAIGNNQFDVIDPNAWEIGRANSGAFGTLRSSTVEIANVDLSQEFSNLVIMQRGYQASSQAITTSNEMIQELFNLRGK